MPRTSFVVELLKPLYQRGMSRDTIRDLSSVIDWMMDLPNDRTDVVIFGAPPVNAYVDEFRMTQDVDVMALQKANKSTFG